MQKRKVCLSLVYRNKQKKVIMKTIIEIQDYKITKNGLTTYFVIDSANQCLFATNTERKAMNFFKKVLACQNISKFN